MPPRLSARRLLPYLAFFAVVLGMTAFGGSASVARAEPPVDFGSGDIVDTVGALGADATRVQSAIDSLRRETGTTLVVAFIDTPTSPSDLEQWSDRVASTNGLGQDNALLVVAVDDSQYWFSVSADSAITESQRQSIARDDIVPSLGEGEWAEAAIGAARRLAEAQGSSLGGASGTSGSSDPSGSSGASGSSGFNFVPTFLILGGFVVAVVLAGLIIARRRASTERRARAESEKQLDLRAGSALIALDNAVTTSEQELGFAIAEFGEDQTGPFRASLDAAKTDLRAAFTLRQQLDDATPDSPEQRTAWLSQILELCARADAALDEQTAAFESLRALARNAPTALAAAEADAERASARLAASENEVQALSALYSPAALADVRGNTAQARSLLDFATRQRTEASAAIAANRGSDAAVSVRGAQQASGQALALLDAVDGTRARLSDVASRLPSALQSIADDLLEARGLTDAQRGLIAGDLDAAVSDGDEAVTRARGADGPRDPARALAELTRREAELDRLLTPVREIAERRRRAEAALERAMVGALSQVRSAEDFITTRRGSVGDAARARLSEARRHLEEAQAIRAADPEAALAEANQATSLAVSAANLARSDASDGWPGGFGTGGSSGAPGGGDMAGAIIGGIIGGMLSGGGRGGYSGGRSSGGFGGFGGSGGLGGGGRRGGGGGFRSGGGRGFGGGGRRGGGGRF